MKRVQFHLEDKHIDYLEKTKQETQVPHSATVRVALDEKMTRTPRAKKRRATK